MKPATSDVEITWNGAFSDEDMLSIRQQLTEILLDENVVTCRCVQLTVSVFGNWRDHVFDGFIYCSCGKQPYTHVRGSLPEPEILITAA